MNKPTTGASALRYDASLEAHGGIARGGSHWWLINRVPAGSQVLDCGCAGGYIAAALSARGCEVDGLEVDPQAADVARASCRRVLVGSLEDEDFLCALPDRYDRIILGDVLEHLVDPGRVLTQLASYLKPGGRVLVSLPNIAHWSIRWNLLRGRFDYEDFGLLDRTHLRFFTFNSAPTLAESAGLRVLTREFTIMPVALSIDFVTRLAHAFHIAAPNLFAYQTLLELDRAPTAGADR